MDLIKGREKGAVTVSTCSVRCCLVFLVTTEEELSTQQARDHLRGSGHPAPTIKLSTATPHFLTVLCAVYENQYFSFVVFAEKVLLQQTEGD